SLPTVFGIDSVERDGRAQTVRVLILQADAVDAAARAGLSDSAIAGEQKTMPAGGLADFRGAEHGRIAGDLRSIVMGAPGNPDDERDSDLLVDVIVIELMPNYGVEVTILNEQIPDILFGGRELSNVEGRPEV